MDNEDKEGHINMGKESEQSATNGPESGHNGDLTSSQTPSKPPLTMTVKLPPSGLDPNLSPENPVTPGSAGIPTPQTPMGQPAYMSPSQSPGDETGLSQELIAAGWRRCWSRRENRPYFFNKNTNTSLWETPQLQVWFRQFTSNHEPNVPSSTDIYIHKTNCWFYHVEAHIEKRVED